MAIKNCAICYEDKIHLAYGFLPCMHCFCIKCIRKFKKKECPYCWTGFLKYTPAASSLPIKYKSPPEFFSRSIENSELVREKLEKRALERLERRRKRRELRRQKKPKKVSRVKKDAEIFKLDEDIKPKKKSKKYRNNRSNRWNSLRSQIN